MSTGLFCNWTIILLMMLYEVRELFPKRDVRVGRAEQLCHGPVGLCTLGVCCLLLDGPVVMVGLRP